MRVANEQVLNENLPIQTQIRILQTQMDKLFHCLQGRVSFGVAYSGLLTGSDTDVIYGQNIEGEFRQFTTGNADTEKTISHSLDSIPIGFIVFWQDKAGSLYQSPTSGTDWTTDNIYLKCNTATVTFLIFIVKKGAIS